MQGLQSADKRESEISNVMNKLDREVEDLQKSFGELEIRINSILRNEPPSSEEQNVSLPEFSSILAQDINKIVSKLNNLRSSINKINDKIEL